MKKMILAVVVLLVIAGVVVAFVFPETWEGFLGEVRNTDAKGLKETVKEKVVDAVSSTKRAHSKEVGASLGVPKGWKSEVRSVGTPALIVANEEGDSVSVTFQRVPPKTRLEAFAREKLKASIKGAVTESESSEGKLGDIAGWKLIATHGEEKDRRTSLIYVLPQAERYYTVHCAAKAERFEEQRAKLEKVAAGLKIEATTGER